MNLPLLFLVAFFWGTSNPLMKKVTSDLPDDSSQGGSLFGHIVNLFKRWKFVAAYLYDQTGSVLYYYALSSTELSVAVPITNGLTFAIAGITESLVDGRIPSRSTLEGSALILLGVYICFSSKQ